MPIPTVTTIKDADGQSLHQVSYPGLPVIVHAQRWQAEWLLEQQAAAEGIILPADWIERPLGRRCLEI